MWWHRPWGPYHHWRYWYSIKPEEELELLKDYKRRLELELQYINERIAELEKKKSEKQ